jgi:hypothetical protein
LEKTTDQVLPRDPFAWWYWWEEYNETVKPKPTQFAYSPTVSTYGRPVVAQYERREQGPSRPPGPPRQGWSLRPLRQRTACFVPGTIVWTETGQTPIEQVQVGDRVFAQHPDTGELALKLVEHVTAGQPTAALAQVTVDGQSLYPTLGHVLWVNGKGWRIAKRLNPGDHVHGLSGAMAVEKLTETPAPPVVHNLIVSDFHTYFVGEKGILVHDFTYREPTRATVPGLVEEPRSSPTSQSDR